MPVCGGSVGFAASRLSLDVSLACSVFCAHPGSASAIASATPSPFKRRIPSTSFSRRRSRKCGLGSSNLARGRMCYRPPPWRKQLLITREAVQANRGGSPRGRAPGSPCVAPPPNRILGGRFGNRPAQARRASRPHARLLRFLAIRRCGMEVVLHRGDVAARPAGALALGILEDERPLEGAAATADRASRGAIKALLERGDFRGRLLEAMTLYPPGLRAARLSLVGR